MRFTYKLNEIGSQKGPEVVISSENVSPFHILCGNWCCCRRNCNMEWILIGFGAKRINSWYLTQAGIFDVGILFLVRDCALFFCFCKCWTPLRLFSTCTAFTAPNLVKFLHFPPRMKVDHAFKAKKVTFRGRKCKKVETWLFWSILEWGFAVEMKPVLMKSFPNLVPNQWFNWCFARRPIFNSK